MQASDVLVWLPNCLLISYEDSKVTSHRGALEVGGALQVTICEIYIGGTACCPQSRLFLLSAI